MPTETQTNRTGNRAPAKTRVWPLLLGGAVAVFLLVYSGPSLTERGYLGNAAQQWYWVWQSKRAFDRVFESENGLFRPEPNAFLLQVADRIPAGRALDVGVGQGRNAIFLASRGWKVTGFDISEVGLRSAAENARRQNVHLETVRASAEDFYYGEDSWDLMLLVYAPVRFEEPGFVGRIRDGLKPGGYVLVEQQVEWHESKGKRIRTPGDIAPGELKQAFSRGFRIVEYSEAEGMSEWFPRRTLIARLLAQKN